MIVADDPIECILRDIKIFKQLKENDTGEKIIENISSNALSPKEKEVTKKTEEEYKVFLTEQGIKDIETLSLYQDAVFTKDMFIVTNRQNIFPMLNSFYILMHLLVIKFNFYFRIMEIYNKNKKQYITSALPYGLEKDDLYTKIDKVYNNHRKLFYDITNLENTLFKYFKFESIYTKIYAMCKDYKIKFDFEYCKDWEKSITSLLTFNKPSDIPNLIHKKTKIEIRFPVNKNELKEFVELHSAINHKYVSEWKNKNADIIKANYKKYCTKFIEYMNTFNYNKYVQEQTTLIEKSINKTDIYDSINRPVDIFNENINIIKDLTDRMKTIFSDTDDIYKKLESFSTLITPFKKQITILHDGLVLLIYNRFPTE